MLETVMNQDPIPVLYQDQHYVIVNKPSGMLVHAYKECTDTTNLMQFVRDQIGQYLYPVHRIDRPVSGIVLFALSSVAASKIKERWHHSETKKEYLTLVKGQITEAGTFDFALTNDKKVKQEAITHYTPLKNYGNWNTLLKVSIDTGRKHQIRRHFSRRCYQVVGDTAHGKGKLNRMFREKYNLHRIFLHSYRLAFCHPFTEDNIEIICPLPGQLENTLQTLEKNLLI